MPYTSNKKPSGLDAATSVIGTDILVIEKSGAVQKATADQLTAYVFGSKTSGAGLTSDTATVRTSGNTLKDVALSNIVPDGTITNAKVSSNTVDRIDGSKITPNFGSQNIVTTGGTSTGTLSASSNTTIGGNLQVTGTITATGGITNSTVVSGTAATANQLTEARNITAGPTGDVSWTVSFNGANNVSAAATIQPNVVTDAKLRSGGACSVIGRSANTTGNVADIQASADNRVLARSSGSLNFVQVTAGMISDGAVTLAKLDPSVKIGGATGGGSDAVFYENDKTVTTNYTITTNKNAMSAGPITVNNGITVTVPNGSSWTIV